MSLLKTYFSYKKFAAPEKRLLFLDKGYFLQKESIAALKKMGHQILVLPVVQNPKNMLAALLKHSVAFKPDAVMTMNHFGFDAEGKIAGVLAELNIPVLVWYLDDYHFIIPNAQPLIQPNVLVATIEKDDLMALRKLGFEHIIYLPTATALDPDKNYVSSRYDFLAGAVSFVGNSFAATKKLWFRPGYKELVDTLSLEDWIKKRRPPFVVYCEQHMETHFISKEELHHFTGYAAAQATQIYRLTILQQLNNASLHLFGDRFWQSLLAHSRWHPPLHNLTEAPAVFASSAINLNISSCQLRKAVNMRLFDVPAAGGFLLTDYQADLDELFDRNSELAIYHSAEELQDKITYYRQHPEEQKRLVRNARRRIRQQHLLPMRLQTLLNEAQKAFT